MTLKFDFQQNEVSFFFFLSHLSALSCITYFVKEKKILTLEEAVNKMTGRTAEYLRIKNKGLIKEGYDADLVIFDYDKLQDTATYSNSNSITEGIDSVYVNGVLVYKDKQFTGAAPGKMLRHNA